MAERVPLFLGLGIVASVLLALGLVMMKSRGKALAPATGRGAGRAIRGWLRDPVWLGGLGVQLIGYALYLIALSGSPVSLLAVMMQGGIAIFVVITVLFLHERASGREWIGIGGVVAAMILLSLSLRGGAATSATSAYALAATSIGALSLAIAPYANARLRDRGLAAALASGIVFGLGSLYAKAVTEIFTTNSADPVATTLLTNPWFYLAIVANLSGLVLLQNSFHWARGIIAMPLSSACSNLVPIVGGILAFGERIPTAGAPATMRIAAFTLTILAGGLLATGRE
jgi:drug/metabolite transporter (DMT)-like permease